MDQLITEEITQLSPVVSGQSCVKVEDFSYDKARDAGQLALDFETAPLSREHRTKHILVEASPYPEAPEVIRRGWEALIPAIIELAHHSDPERLTLLQSVRKTKNLKGSGSRAYGPDTFTDDGDVLDGWLYDVLVPIGTLPIDNVEASEKFSITGASRLISPIDEPYDANISAQSRNEAMMCLEMLCTKVWYEKHREVRSDAYIEQSIRNALEFLYWECGIPVSLTLFFDEPLPLWHSTYEQVRKFNYRQLYAIARENLMDALVDRIQQGVRALRERRQYFKRHFRRSLRQDPRWSRSFSQQVEFIKRKYSTDV